MAPCRRKRRLAVAGGRLEQNQAARRGVVEDSQQPASLDGKPAEGRRHGPCQGDLREIAGDRMAVALRCDLSHQRALQTNSGSPAGWIPIQTPAPLKAFELGQEIELLEYFGS